MQLMTGEWSDDYDPNAGLGVVGYKAETGPAYGGSELFVE